MSKVEKKVEEVKGELTTKIKSFKNYWSFFRKYSRFAGY